MEFIDEDTRPRFLFQSRSSHPSSPLPETLKISKLHATTCLSISTSILIATFFISSTNSILFNLLIWISLSLLLAPFAPPSSTGGDPIVGRGDPLPPPLPKPTDLDEPRRRPSSRSNPKSTIPNPKPDEKREVDPATKEENQRDESVIRAAKSLAERRVSVVENVGWSSVEDIALINALKAFPKDVAMRWEKVAAAVPGKSKVECVKRVAELKRDFRSSKSSEK